MEDEDESCGPERTFVALAGLLDSVRADCSNGGRSELPSKLHDATRRAIRMRHERPLDNALEMLLS